jgi:hypothetical protein
MRKFYAMEARGEIPKGTTERWKKHTKSISKLPERKSTKKEEKAKTQKKEASIALPAPTWDTYLAISRYIDLVKSANVMRDVHTIAGQNQYTGPTSISTLLEKTRPKQLALPSLRNPVSSLMQMLRQLSFQPKDRYLRYV